MTLKKGNLGTNIKVKRENFEKFTELMRNQFEHGGSKYAGNDDLGREFTDLVCDAFPGECGVDWVLGTIMKYLGRFKNFRREKDLLKIATYCYIIWLKFGFHLEYKHDEDIFDNNGDCENVDCEEQCFEGTGEGDEQTEKLMESCVKRCVPRLPEAQYFILRDEVERRSESLSKESIG